MLRGISGRACVFICAFVLMYGSAGVLTRLKLQNWLLFVSVVLLWGSNWSIMKVELNILQAPVTFVLHRFLVSVAVLFPGFVLLRRRLPRDRGTLVKLFMLCLIFVSIIVTQAFGLMEESSGIGSVLSYTQPLFVFCLAVPFLNEKLTTVKVVGVIVGFLGVVILFLGRVTAFPADSILVMLFGAFLWAVSVLFYKRFLTHVDPFVTHFMQLAVGSVFLCAYVFGTSGFVVSADVTYVGLLIISSIGALAAGNVVWLYLLKKEEATTLSGSSLIIPAVALVFGRWILGESLGFESILGSGLTLAGVYLVNWRGRNNAHAASQGKA